MIKYILWVGLGGFAGSVVRYLLALYFNPRNVLPWGTLLANVAGCFLIGLVVTMADQKGMITKEMRLLFATGFCGSLTTFSTFVLESVQIWSKSFWMMLAYMAASIILGFPAFLLGSRI